MQIEVKQKLEDGTVEVAGKLNDIEVSFLVQFAINALMSMGAEIDLKEDDDSGKKSRVKMPKGTTLQ